MRLPGIEPKPAADPDVSPEEEFARGFSDMAASLGDADYWHSLSRDAMAQGRFDFAIREIEYRERAAQEVRDRAAMLLDRLGAYAKAILRQSRYRVVGYRAEANTGRVETNRSILTADDFAVLSIDLSNGWLVLPGAGLKYVGVTVREFQTADGDGDGEVDLNKGSGSLLNKPVAKVMTSSEPYRVRDEPEQARPVRRPRRGPQPGDLDRYGLADRALLPELRVIMEREQLSATAAARKLADQNKILGHGTSESRTKRLASLYHREKKKSSGKLG
jgi:hypothetical protein